jgi:TolB-like protein
MKSAILAIVAQTVFTIEWHMRLLLNASERLAVTEEIITQLGRTASSGVGIIAGPSVRRYRGKNPTLRQLANDLGVGYVLTGSIRREASTLRITARLVRTRDELQIWSESFDRDAADVLALEQNVAVSVASAVATRRSADAVHPWMGLVVVRGLPSSPDLVSPREARFPCTPIN